MNNLSILIIEDHLLLGDAWAFYFRAKTSFNVLGPVSTPSAARQIVRSSPPDIILLDINLGEVSGLDLIPVLLRASPGSRIIIVTISAFPWLAKKAMKAGAKGFLTKNEDFEVFLHAISVIAAGGVFISVAGMESPDKAAGDSIPPAPQALSKKEQQIIRYICEGLRTMDIAKKLKVSASTVEAHRHNIMTKLKLRNAIELNNYFLKNFAG